MSTALEVKETTFSELWELEPSREGKYTENDVIDAYLKGKKTGLESIQKTLVKALDENIDKCGAYTEHVLKHLTEYDIKVKDAFLRINNFDFFNILVCVPEKDFLDDKFFDIYNFITEFEDSKNTIENNFTVEFSFLDFSSDFDYCVNKINSDGYILRLKKITIMRFEHGEHNEALCDHLLNNTPSQFNDWVVTTAFYACIHFVEHKLFPTTIDSDTFECFDDYCDHQHNKMKSSLSKHSLKADLVKKRIPAVNAQYRWLKESCMNSRYTNYKVSDEKAKSSNKLMKIIKEACIKEIKTA